jgi:hypothetical protein
MLLQEKELPWKMEFIAPPLPRTLVVSRTQNPAGFLIAPISLTFPILILFPYKCFGSNVVKEVETARFFLGLLLRTSIMAEFTFILHS